MQRYGNDLPLFVTAIVVAGVNPPHHVGRERGSHLLTAVPMGQQLGALLWRWACLRS
jgi:hypothetical protein